MNEKLNGILDTLDVPEAVKIRLLYYYRDSGVDISSLTTQSLIQLVMDTDCTGPRVKINGKYTYNLGRNTILHLSKALLRQTTGN